MNRSGRDYYLFIYYYIMLKYSERGQEERRPPSAISIIQLKPLLTRLIQNDFIGKAKAGEARKTGFSRLLVYFNLSLQNGFTLQYIDLRKINEDEADINHGKEVLNNAPCSAPAPTRHAGVWLLSSAYTYVLLMSYTVGNERIRAPNSFKKVSFA